MCAHASSLERCKTQLKKIKKQRWKKLEEWNKIEPEEKERILQARHTKTLSSKVQIAIWDYKHSQFAFNKRDELKKLLQEAVVSNEISDVIKNEIQVILDELK